MPPWIPQDATVICSNILALSSASLSAPEYCLPEASRDENALKVSHLGLVLKRFVLICRSVRYLITRVWIRSICMQNGDGFCSASAYMVSASVYFDIAAHSKCIFLGGTIVLCLYLIRCCDGRVQTDRKMVKMTCNCNTCKFINI